MDTKRIMGDTGSNSVGSPRFEIRRRIGSGGMGVVHEAWDRQLQMRVALKTLAETDPARLYRFKQEFRNLTGVVHRNLVTLYELFAVDDSWFFTMELIDGSDFLHYVRRGPPDSAAEVEDEDSSDDEPTMVRTRAPRTSTASALGEAHQFDRLRACVLELTRAVAALHAAGKLHRDIKPSNVLVTREGRTVLLDFGLTIALRGEEEPDQLLSGTIPYMSPEQASRKPLTTASDWYSVGVMLFQALTGKLPFEGTSNDVLFAKAHRAAPSVAKLNTGAPDTLVRLCDALLDRKPENRPNADQIQEYLGADSEGPVGALGDLPIIGRDEHLQAMRDAFETMRSGRLVTLFVHGESGKGKSFLVQQFFDRLADEIDPVILSGRCYEAESVPYKALDSMIDNLSRLLERTPALAAQVVPRDARPLVRVFPSLKGVPALAGAPERPGDDSSDQEVRRRAARGLREMLSRLGDRVPLVLSIDDLQWGDFDSGVILSEVLRGPDPPILLFIGIYRRENADSSPILQQLLTRGVHSPSSERRHLAIDELSFFDSCSLAAEILREFGDERKHVAEAIARESGGVPYFVYELARFVGGGAEISDQSISLEEVLRRRFDALGEGQRSLLETVALAGQPIRQKDAYIAACLEAEERAAVMQLRGGHLVRTTGPGEDDRVEPYHDRIRETLIALMPEATRRQRHASLATTLESSGDSDPETLAIHFRGAGEPDKAAGYYSAAARQAASALAFDRAANLDGEALALTASEDPHRQALLVHRADALANAGRGAEAAAGYEAALAGADPQEVVDLRRKAAYQYCISGHIADGRQAMRELLRRYDIRMPESPGAIIMTLLWNRLKLWFRGYDFEVRDANTIDHAILTRIDVVWSAAAGLSMNDIIAGAGLQTCGLLLALKSGDLERVGRSIAWEATHKSNDGSKGWKKTSALLDLAQQIAERSGSPHPLAMATLARGIAEFTMGRWATALPLLDQAETMFRERCTGVAWELDTGQAFALWSLVYMGEFDEMSRRTSSLLQEAEERGDLYAATTLGVFHHPHALLARNEPAAARDSVRSSIDKWTSEGFYLQDLCALMTESLIDTYEGDGVRGHERWTRKWKAVEASQLLRSQCIRSLTHHFRARSALAGAMQGSRPDLLRSATADARRLRREGVAWCEPYSRVLFAGIERIRGNVDESMRLYRESAEGFDRVDMRSHAAAARWALGELIGGSDGEELMNQAETWMKSRGIDNVRAMARMHVGAIA